MPSAWIQLTSLWLGIVVGFDCLLLRVGVGYVLPIGSQLPSQSLGCQGSRLRRCRDAWLLEIPL
jgi:hypothetical protein